jgi:hypothetical protein
VEGGYDEGPLGECRRLRPSRESCENMEVFRRELVTCVLLEPTAFEFESMGIQGLVLSGEEGQEDTLTLTAPTARMLTHRVDPR